MDEKFKKIKNKCLIEALIKSAVIGISAGLFVTGIILLSLVLTGNSIHWAIYIPIGLISALAGGGVSFLFMRPSDMRVAKKYDTEFGLNEKLQTMVAFSGQEGDIIALQRSDASETLASLPARKIRFSQIWQYCLCAVLALALFFSAVFIPVSAQEGGNNGGGENPPEGELPEDKDPVFEYDLFMQSALTELILNVRESSLEQNLKNSVVEELENLDVNLGSADTRKKMLEKVVSSVEVIDALVDGSNSFRKISEAIAGFDEEFASAIRESVGVYNSSSTPLNDIVRVRAFELRIGDLIEIVLEEFFTSAKTALKIPQDGIENEETGETVKLADVLNPYILNLGLAIELAELDESEDFYIALDKFNSALTVISGKIGKYSDKTLFTDLDNAFSALGPELNSALSVECYSYVINLFIRNRLADIFSIKANEFPEFNEDLVPDDNNGGDDPGGEENDDPSGSGGGNGDYDFIYGSDDVIYDPDRADYVKFGEVLDEYYAKMQNKVIAGEVTADLAKIMEVYFEILYNGIKKDEVEQ